MASSSIRVYRLLDGDREELSDSHVEAGGGELGFRIPVAVSPGWANVL
jgi:hypothetical protein